MPFAQDERHALECLLEARSVAVVGASGREGSVGNQTLLELLKGGYDGDVYPVNPKYEEILGFRCYGTLSDVPGPVDLVVLALANRLLEEQFELAASVGARSAAIFASGYEEPRSGVPALTVRLATIARDAGMAVCGGNGMGFLNVERGLRVCGFYEPQDLVPGSITFVSHSGSAFSAMLHNDRGLRFNLVVSAGQELTTTVADYLAYALELESTRVMGLFLETVRDAPAFRAGLERANELDVPIVALKVGREALTRRLVEAHSGALAGEDGAYEALFDAYGVSRVESLDEMADTLALFQAGRRAGPGALASIHDSGGERALIVDSAASVGVPLAEIADRTRDRMAELLEPGLPPVNPLDFWGTGREGAEIVTGCMRALLDDPAVAALAFAVDLTTEDDPSTGYMGMARTVFPETGKPIAMLSNFSSGIDRGDVRLLDEAGIPVLEGTLTGLAAFKHLFAYRDHRARAPVAGSSPASEEARERWRARVRSGEELTEAEGLALLADYGIRTVAARAVDSLEGALDAAEGMWPVALKTAAPGVHHKSDVDGVRLHVENSGRLRAAYLEMAERLGPRATVAAMAPVGVEMALGIVRDPQFGPLVLVGSGGLLIELLKDRRLALPPLDESRSRSMIDRLEGRRLLDGVRGAPAANVDALVRAVVSMSWLAHDLGDELEAIDANPVIVGPEGVFAVDALVSARARR